MSTERKATDHPNTERHETHPTPQDVHKGLRELKDNWGGTKNELRRNYEELEASDVELDPGHEQETIDRIGQRLHKTPEEAMRLVQEIAQRHQKPHNTAASTVGTPTPGIPDGHKDMPEAAERKSRRDRLKKDERSK